MIFHPATHAFGSRKCFKPHCGRPGASSFSLREKVAGEVRRMREDPIGARENPHPDPSPVGEGRSAFPSCYPLSRALGLSPFDFGDEGGDGSPDGLGMILLEKMNAVAELHEPAIPKLAG